jgi:flagellar biosynthetic protein FlhB
MAEHDRERTEEPTQKKLDDAIQRGDVARSQEVNTWFIIAGGTLVLVAFSGSASLDLKATLSGLLANAGDIVVTGPDLIRLTEHIGLEVLGAMAIPMMLLVLAAICGSIIQHRFVWSVEPLIPRLSKVSPGAGLKRLFSTQALANFLKGIVKLVLVGGVMTALLWPQRYRIDDMVGTDPAAILPMIQTLTFKIMSVVVAILAVIAAADYLFQYRQWHEKQKMSIEELKEEFKQTEGNPAIKSKIRQLRQNRSKKRMMAAVPTASVIITNPTHYAVALQYERGMSAPICVAKGVDVLARRIREVATEHSIPIVENPPLARALHATVDIDEEIPAEHYQAVAEVIGYVM